MKQLCIICGTTGELSEFYASVNSRCKECHKTKVKEVRLARADYYKAYDAQRFQDDPRVKERHKRYQTTDQGKAARRRAKAKWNAEHPDKRAAHVILGNAVRDNRIPKPSCCSVCGVGGRIEGHHEDYSLPLVVKWLCRECHVAEHKSDHSTVDRRGGPKTPRKPSPGRAR